MESLVLALNVILPVFVLIVIGYGLVKKQIVGRESFIELNKALFAIFLPCSMVLTILESDLSQPINMKLFKLAVGGLVVCVVVTMGLVARRESNRRKRASIVQGIFRSNFLLFGVPIIQSIYGSEELAVVTIFIASVIPVLNALAVFVLQYYRGDGLDIKEICVEIVRNPLMFASFLGFTLLYAKIQLPMFVMTSLRYNAQLVTPLALIALGGSMQIGSLSENKKQLFVLTMGKLVVFPAIGAAVAIFMGFRGIELLTLTMLFGSPCAIASFTMAQVMDADCELAAQGILSTTLCSVVSVFLFIFSYGAMGLI